MISKSGRDPVDGGLESGSEGKAQCFVSGVLHAAGRPHWFTGGVGELEVSIHRLKMKKKKKNMSWKQSLDSNVQNVEREKKRNS